MRVWAHAAVLVGWLMSGTPAQRPLAAPPARTVLTPRAVVPAPAVAGRASTRCEACHAPAAWVPAQFPHERTGFSLEGSHARVACQRCHGRDLRAPLPQVCASCHKDAHSGEFGQRCEGCHNSESWRSEFTADAHRRTNFPLLGRHAAIPCQECHVDRRGPSFRLSTVECDTCHRADYDRTAITSVDHAAAGFSTRCRECHETWTFSGAHFPAHEACFPLAGTAHGGFTCLSCHSSLAGARATGACATHTASCSGCHTHTCDRSDAQHRSVPGYQCQDTRCYECHRLPER